jgi:type IX secretion system PorP/SprF family membrane protein
MKKNLLLSTVLAVVSTTLSAQYIPNNSQGYQFMQLFNPAFTGVENFDDLKFSYRYQWAGFGKSSPKFINLSYQKRIRQPVDLAYNAQRLSNFSGLSMEQLPRAKRIIHGLGANIFQSRVGILSSLGGSVNYAINYPLSKTARLALGFTALIENRKLDIASVSVRDPDPYYDYLLRGSTAQTDLNIRAGALLYKENFYIGFSYLPLINIALQASDLAMEKPFYRGSFQTGFSFPFNPDITFKPSLLVLMQMNNELVVDYNVKAYIQNKVLLGLTYRDIQSGAALIGFNINDTFTVSYSFELSLGDFKKFDDGSHELVLAGRLNNLKRFTQYIW